MGNLFIGATGRAIRRHLLITVGLTAIVIAVVVALEMYLVRTEADRYTAATAERVSAVSGVLAELDLGDDAPIANEVDAALDPLISLGIIDRVKIWRVEGDKVRVIYSDETRVVGEQRPFDADLAERLDSGEVVVLPVPDDHEHRFEQDVPMREAYVGFTDASGIGMRMELYVATFDDENLLRSLSVQIPVIAGSLILLSGLLMPLTVRTVRRLDRLAQERHDALAYGLAASEGVRHDLAHRLHDGVIQDLAAVGLALSSIAERNKDPATAALLRQVADIVGRDTDDLRAIAEESAPRLQHSLTEHLERLPLLGTSDVVLIVEEPPDRLSEKMTTLLWRVAAELVNNAVKHASASRIAVVVTTSGSAVQLVVTDDGVGYAPGRVKPGHLGLLLVDRSVDAAGGTFSIVGSEAGTTATLTISLPSAAT